MMRTVGRVSGFTLIELIVGIVLLAVAVMGAIGMAILVYTAQSLFRRKSA